MTDIIGNLRSRETRYQIKQNEGVTVTIAREDASCESIEVKLLDISTGGARIKAGKKISAKEVLALKIETEHPKRVLAVSGEVCWVSPAARDDWSMGCRFQPQVPKEILHEFAAAKILERREHRREQASLRATAIWELKSGSSAVSIEDYSKGGICLRSKVESRPGERTLLQFEGDDERVVDVPVKIKWQVRSHDSFIIGCEFVNSHDFGVLCSLTGVKKDTPTHIPKLIPSLGILAVCAASLFVMTGPPIQSSAKQPPERTSQIASSPESWVAPKETNDPDLSSDEAVPSALTEPNLLPATFDSRLTEIDVVQQNDAQQNERVPDKLQDRVEDQERVLAQTELKQRKPGNDVQEESRPNKSVNLETPAIQFPSKLVIEPRSRGGSFAANVGGVNRPIKSPTNSVEMNNKSLNPNGDGQLSGVTANVAHQSAGPNVKNTPTDSTKPTDTTETSRSNRTGYRIWTDATGRYRAVARLISVKGNVAKLQKEDGGFASVKLDRLCEDDLEYVQRFSK